jgi:O-antigen/teichoic acid export membrane protein
MTDPVSTDPLAVEDPSFPPNGDPAAHSGSEVARPNLQGGAGIVIKGMTWVASGNILSRGISLLGQVVTAWLLLPEDYGAYAFAISISAAVAALRGGGIAQLIIKDGSSYASKAPLYFKYTLLLNVIAMAILFVPGLIYISKKPSVGLVILAVAIAIPLGTYATIYKAKLAVDHRFKDIASINLGSALVWQAGVVGFALMGFGAKSFALPVIMQAIYESVVSARHVKSRSSLWSFSGGGYRNIFRQTRWIMLSTAALAFATTGDYFAVGIITNARTVGIYFFAFQLIVAITTPVNLAIETVFPALLARLNGDSSRQIRAFSRTIAVIASAGLSAFGTMLIALPMAIHWTWQGKWDMATPAVLTLAVCLPGWLLIAASRALIEARGLWRFRFTFLAAYGLGGMSSAAIGALTWGGVQAIATCVAIFYVSIALVLLVSLTRLGVRLRETIGSLFVPLMINVVAFFASQFLDRLVPIGVSPNLNAGVRLSCFMLMAAIGNWLFLRRYWTEILMTVRQAVRPSLVGKS